MNNENIIYEAKGPIGIITFNRPNAMNSVTNQMTLELKSTLAIIEKDPAIRVIVLRANGPVFCAGADFSLLSELHPATKASEELKLLYDTVNYLSIIPKPVVAAVQGPATGGGLSVALACDFIFASDKAKFGAVFVNIGLGPDTGGLRTLVKYAGLRRAKELFMTGRLISAQEALEYNMVNKVTTSENLDDEVFSFAQMLAEKAPISLSYIKTLSNTLDECSAETYLFMEREMLAKTLQTKDHSEGLQAFMKKRKPVFTGE